MKDAYNVLSVRYYRLSARTTLCLRGISYGPVSVSLSVCLSEAGIVSKRMDESSWL